MSIISIRLPEKLLREVEDLTQALHISRAKYIRKAIEHMNEEVTKRVM